MTLRPTGTITFLFTDIEASTRHWEDHRAWMQHAFARQEQIIREAAAAHDGYVYKMIGDAFQIAFCDAGSAVAAAVDAQRALQRSTGVIAVRCASGWRCIPASPRNGVTIIVALRSTALDGSCPRHWEIKSCYRKQRMTSCAIHFLPKFPFGTWANTGSKT